MHILFILWIKSQGRHETTTGGIVGTADPAIIGLEVLQRLLDRNRVQVVDQVRQLLANEPNVFRAGFASGFVHLFANELQRLPK